MVRLILFIIIFLCFSCHSRNGNKIYRTLFGKTKFKYDVINSQDHVSTIDCCIWLHAKAEKEEIIRISQLHQHEHIEIANLIHLYEPGKGEVPQWFNPSKLKDGFNVSFAIDEQERNTQSYYISKDTTEVFIVDILI